MNFHFLVQLEFNCYCIFTLFFFYQSWLADLCTRFSQPPGHQHGARHSKGSTSLFLLTFLFVCLIYLESPCPRHQSFPGFRASFDFKESWVVRSVLKHMKGKDKKVLLPSRMLHYAPRKELNIHHLNVESSPCLGERTS